VFITLFSRAARRGRAALSADFDIAILWFFLLLVNAKGRISVALRPGFCYDSREEIRDFI
jgi:hypothetical protein